MRSVGGLVSPVAYSLAWSVDALVVGLPGDYNENGVVDAADYTAWRDNLGSDVSLPNDDTAGVGMDDYTRWKTNVGQMAGAGALGSTAVPEPSSALLALLGLAAVSLNRPPRSRR